MRCDNKIKSLQDKVETAEMAIREIQILKLDQTRSVSRITSTRKVYQNYTNLLVERLPSKMTFL